MAFAAHYSTVRELPPPTRKPPLRSEVAPEDTWDLTALYASDEAWEDDLRALQEHYPRIAAFQGRVGESPASLLECLEFEKAVDLRIEQLNQYAGLRVTEDSSNADALAREARLQALLVRAGEAFSFVAPEIQAIPDDAFAAWIDDPILGEWRIALKKLRRMKPHTLTPGEERLLALGSSALAGHQETFSQLTNVDMIFGSVRDDSGREVELTQSSFSSLLVQRMPSVRREAFHKFYAEFSGHRYTLASSLASSVRSGVFYARARNYPSAIEAALFRDDVPLAVYDNLIATIRSNLGPLFRYFALRKRVLGLDEIHHYDTYVPLVSEIETRIPWDDAVDRVIVAVRPLGNEYISELEHGLRRGRWCDRYENKGKRSGAFSSGGFKGPPYIMMNYKEDVFSDVYTLAHEAGHSMHTWYSKNTRLYQDYHYPIFLAEVASTFNEMLLTQHLLDTTDDSRMRAYIVSRQLDDLRGTLYRQTMFAEFEKKIHSIEESDGALTLDTFKSAYHELLEAYFGPDFMLDEELDLECLRIPHFYHAFYVYKYATGISAAVALSEQVLASGDATQYLGFLRSGGSRFPIETLAEAGVDMSSPAPIQAALALFARRVEELEQLLL
jgi:oligoendopeptidase F